MNTRSNTMLAIAAVALRFAADARGQEVVPFRSAYPRKPLPKPAPGGMNPLWLRDGKELFYRNGNDDLVAVEVTATGMPPLGRQRVLFPAGAYTAEATHRQYDITPDGKRFVMIRKSVDANPAFDQLVVVENFFEVLKKKVPR